MWQNSIYNCFPSFTKIILHCYWAKNSSTSFIKEAFIFFTITKYLSVVQVWNHIGFPLLKIFRDLFSHVMCWLWYIHVWAPCACLMSIKARRGHWMPLDWSFVLLQTATWMLGIEHRSFARASSAFNCWVNWYVLRSFLLKFMDKEVEFMLSTYSFLPWISERYQYIVIFCEGQR